MGKNGLNIGNHVVYIDFRHYSPASVAQWMSADLRTKGLLVQFPVRAYAWVVGQIPSRNLGMEEATTH